MGKDIPCIKKAGMAIYMCVCVYIIYILGVAILISDLSWRWTSRQEVLPEVKRTISQ